MMKKKFIKRSILGVVISLCFLYAVWITVKATQVRQVAVSDASMHRPDRLVRSQRPETIDQAELSGGCSGQMTETDTDELQVAVLDDSFQDSDWGEFKLTVYYPQDKTKAPYETVIFAHGSMVSKEMYTWVGWQLASQDYVVLLYSIPNSFEPIPLKYVSGNIGAVDYLIKANQSGELKGIINTQKIGLAGHSLGANGVLMSANEDESFQALVLLAPGYPKEDGDEAQAEMGEIMRQSSFFVNQPTQIQVGSLDKLAMPEMSLAHYQQLPGTKELMEINGGNHINFLDEGLYYSVAQFFDNRSEISHEEQLNISKKYMTAWFDYYLKEDELAREIIFGSQIEADLTNGILSKLEFME